MPVSKYFKGKGKEVMKDMQKRYGRKKGKEVFYATANKNDMTLKEGFDKQAFISGYIDKTAAPIGAGGGERLAINTGEAKRLELRRQMFQRKILQKKFTKALQDMLKTHKPDKIKATPGISG